MAESNIIEELIIDEEHFSNTTEPPLGYSLNECNCSNTYIIEHKYMVSYSKYKENDIIDISEFKKLIKEYNLKLVVIIYTPPVYSDQKCIIKDGEMKSNESEEFLNDPRNSDILLMRRRTGQGVFDIKDSLQCMNYLYGENYICDVELTMNSKIKKYGYIFLVNEYEIKNERKITVPELVKMIYDKHMHDYMYIDTHIADCSMCIKKSYKERREYNKQPIMNGKYFKNKNLKYISFEKLNMVVMSSKYGGHEKNITKFIEISDFNRVRDMAYKQKINMIDFISDYIYDVEIQDDSQIFKNDYIYYMYPNDRYSRCESVCMYICDNATIKLTNKRKLIDDVLLMSYLYYNLFKYHSCINKKEFNSIFFRNILGYFIEDTLSVKINKMIDLFFNSRAYLLDLEKVKQGWNDTYMNIDVYILSLFNVENESMKEECNRQCIEFIKSLLDTIMNRKHILIKNFSDEELKNLCDRIIKCITINKCVETNIIETLGIQFEQLKIKDSV